MARQDDPSLDGLFQRLKSVEDPVAAAALQDAIWEAWIYTPEPGEMQLMLQGIQAMHERRLRDALSIFDELCRVAPHYAEAWNKRATVNWLLDEPEKSVADIGRTLALEPRHWGALSGLGMIEVGRGNYGAAMRAYERALSVNPHLHDMRGELERLRKIRRDRET